MAMNVYLLNRTYIAQDSSTGLVAYGTTEQSALDQLTKLLSDYWDKKKVVVPINKGNEDPEPQASSIKMQKTKEKNG
jgi:hypothetical protein